MPYTAAIGASYVAARLNPRRPETTLEDFLVNRFGDTLYRTFFKDYTEKVWGVPCAEISAEWGAQRIKGLSISKAIAHALSKPFRAATRRRSAPRPAWSSASCIRSSGPGQMWEHVAGASWPRRAAKCTCVTASSACSATASGSRRGRTRCGHAVRCAAWPATS